MNGTWVKLYHVLLDSSVMQDDWHFRLFIWCLLKANYKESGFRGQTVQPGQFITGRSTGADALNVSPSKFYRGLLTLQNKYESIKVEANNNWTTVTIVNWQSYQFDARESEQQLNNGWTTDEQRMNNERTTDEHNLREIEGQRDRGTERKRRSPKAANFDAKLFPIPDQLNSPEFLDAWHLWIRHRIEKKKPFTETATKQQFEEFVGWGAPRSIAAIKFSISKSWDGVYEQKVSFGAQQDILGSLRRVAESGEK